MYPASSNGGAGAEKENDTASSRARAILLAIVLQPADARLLHTPNYDSYQAFDGQITLDWNEGTPVESWTGVGIDWARLADKKDKGPFAPALGRGSR